MRNFDLTPLLRSSIGFDRMQRALESASRMDAANTYPPYDIEVNGDDDYRITMALAGFSSDDIDIIYQENSLVIQSKSKTEETDEKKYIHRGIARRGFERRFELADHVKVIGAHMENGLLHVDLQREIPQALKPRKIEIVNASESKALEATSAA